MAHFDNRSPEYKDNGHYVINNIDFMSLWRFKENHGLSSTNDNQINAEDGIKIGGAEHTCEVELKSKFETVNIYPLEVLKSYYGKL